MAVFSPLRDIGKEGFNRSLPVVRVYGFGPLPVLAQILLSNEFSEGPV